ncbi:hypothetical protein PPYR_13816 [Photinus pyralis]|uniref:Dynein regulatory complex protein 10 n=2 Tax=Photinus pyralis TaxID=7054 RepID=A0A5N4AA39_PHOPY|nr:dynein regulatory complex protein 10-like [Photinus pyralis]KAB0794196.1 hypothetical protein PPYR_13816 [Photinus pyralis]
MPDFERVKKSRNEDDDVEVQASRVLRVMNNAIAKLKIATCLPAFISDDSLLLRKYLRNDEVDFIQVTCEQYISPLGQQARMTKKNSVAHPRMALALDMIWNNMELRNLALENHGDLADPTALPLIDSIHSLTQLTETKLGQTAKEERLSRKQLRTAWYENAEMQKQLSELTTKIERQGDEGESKIVQSMQLVRSYQNKILSHIQTVKRTIKERVENSEKTMYGESTASLVRQANLSSDAKTVTNQYEAVLSQHLNVEKKLRAKRLKVETQLANWLSKYDADMGERQAEFEHLDDIYNRQKESMDLLRVMVAEQQAEYEALWTERLEEGLANLRVNRAARIIQRCWRKYRAKKLAAKRGKSDKKKKKKKGK